VSLRAPVLAISVLAVASGGTLLGLGLTSGSAPQSLPPPPAATAPPAPAVPVTRAPPAVPRRQPARVLIPAIGVDAAVTPEGTDSAGALQMPSLSAPNLTAWWDGGAAPGQDGPAVIAGHVDNASGPLVFWNLRLLRPGDRVETEPGNLVFTVTSVTQVSKSAFPTAQVYGPVQDPQLRLITCGGSFDPATGHYLDNVIVYARETG
jgi:Sortase domain